MKTNDYATTRDRVLTNPTVSFRLKEALRAFDKADPVDALNDAVTLEQLAHQRLKELHNRP